MESLDQGTVSRPSVGGADCGQGLEADCGGVKITMECPDPEYGPFEKHF